MLCKGLEKGTLNQPPPPPPHHSPIAAYRRQWTSELVQIMACRLLDIDFDEAFKKIREGVTY